MELRLDYGRAFEVRARERGPRNVDIVQEWDNGHAETLASIEVGPDGIDLAEVASAAWANLSDQLTRG